MGKISKKKDGNINHEALDYFSLVPNFAEKMRKNDRVEREWYITLNQLRKLILLKTKTQDGFHNDIISLNNRQNSNIYQYVHIITHQGIKYICSSKTPYRWKWNEQLPL